jgi:hypothetical protein
LSGITIGGTQKTKNGKILVNQEPSLATKEHIHHLNTILHSPKKRTVSDSQKTPNQRPKTTTQNSNNLREAHNPTVTPNMEKAYVNKVDDRLLVLEEKFTQQEQQNTIFHNRLISLETTANRTDNNVAAILERLESLSEGNLRRKHDNRTMQIDDMEMPIPYHTGNQGNGNF